MSGHQVVDQVWKWNQPTRGAAPAKRPWGRALLQAAVAAAVGAFLWHRGHRVFPGILFALSSFVAVSGLFIPRAFLAFEKAGKLLGQLVGNALSWILLVPTFFLIFFPARILLILTGRDPMRRTFPSDEKTYWVKRPPVKDVGEYSRQF